MINMHDKALGREAPKAPGRGREDVIYRGKTRFAHALDVRCSQFSSLWSKVSRSVVLCDTVWDQNFHVEAFVYQNESSKRALLTRDFHLSAQLVVSDFSHARFLMSDEN